MKTIMSFFSWATITSWFSSQLGLFFFANRFMKNQSVNILVLPSKFRPEDLYPPLSLDCPTSHHGLGYHFRQLGLIFHPICFEPVCVHSYPLHSPRLYCFLVPWRKCVGFLENVCEKRVTKFDFLENSKFNSKNYNCNWFILGNFCPNRICKEDVDLHKWSSSPAFRQVHYKLLL